jgi:cell division protein ZapA (FtsZ GTPase activity inhibitor)
MVQLVEWMDEAICNHENEEVLANIAQSVKAKMSKFPLVS